MKEQLLGAAQEMLRGGLVEGTAGNVAARLPDGNVVLTPSSLDYLEMTLDDLVVCDLDGNVVEGHRGPTTEKALHLSALRRYPEINATMHCHAKHCTMFALTRQPIPAVIEEFVVYVGGDVPVRRLQDHRHRRARRRGRRAGSATASAVLMANHGLFAVGKNPADVLHIAGLVERTAEIVWGAQRLGEIVPLPPSDQRRSSPATTATAAPGSSETRRSERTTCRRRQRLRSSVRPSPMREHRGVDPVVGRDHVVERADRDGRSSSTPSSTTAPPHSVLSTRISPLGRSRVSSSS